MSEEQNPSWKSNKIPLGESRKIVIKTPNAVASGTSKFGTWELWSIEVRNGLVFEGRGKAQKEIENYTGEAVFFPSEKVIEKLSAILGGRENIEVENKRVAKENSRGSPYTDYEVSEVGNASSDNLFDSKEETKENYNDVEKEVISRAKLIPGVTIEQVIDGCKQKNIDEARATEIYNKEIKQ